VKFGGGLLTTFSSNLLKLVDIPDTFPGYGLDDTFVMQCCNIMKRSNIDIQQYVLSNIIVMENKKYKFKNPYVNTELLADKTMGDGGNALKKKFREVAEKNYENEVNKFVNRMLDVK